MEIRWPGTIEDGRVCLDNPADFHLSLKKMEGKRIQVSVRRYKTSRTDPQNKYYWGVVVEMLGNELGYMPEEMHEALKWKFLRKGGKLETVKSTTSLNTIEFEIFLEKVRIWAITDFQIKIPLPNEVDL